MTWVAVIPFKGGAEHKTRLATVLSSEMRAALALQCLRHVVATLREAGAKQIAVLSDQRPPGWDGPVLDDPGPDVNAALTEVHKTRQALPLLVIHADLPLLCRTDIHAMLADPKCITLAPDRHGIGTNAIALPAASVFEFGFGPGSCARHIASAAGRATILRRLGLSFDLDTPADLALLVAGCGQSFMPPRA